MDTHALFVSGRSRRTVALMLVLVAALSLSRAHADLVTQLFPFFYPDGSQVVSVNGEPDDAVLNRFYDTQKDRIIWQLMTQHLEPQEEYDIWLEGSNDGSDSFSWWVGRAKANARGSLNAMGTVHVGIPEGPALGSFENPGAEANLVIRSTDGVTMQTAYFPGL
jgi:hypothetical protein